MADAPPPAAGRTALLVIDMINDLSFDGGERLCAPAEAVAQRIAALREAADAAGVPVVTVNDNFGAWHSDRQAITDHCRRDDAPGAALLDLLPPREADYFVVKPQFSGFYATTLPVLLPQLEASRLILTGLAADICVLFTAADAHMRQYDLWVPEDCTASEDAAHKDWALALMRHSMCADTRSTDDLSLADWVALGA